MSNNHKTITSVVGAKIKHDFSHETGTITETRTDIRGYAYYVKWDLYPEHNGWYQLNVLQRQGDND